MDQSKAVASSVSIEFVKELAKEAGRMICDNIQNRQKNINTKVSVNDLVTQTDIDIEKKLKSIIKERYPNHRFLCEESADPSQTLTDEPTWVIDPIDGTANFVHTFPCCCVSIAYCENRETRLACVYAPMLNERFTAVKGEGAFLNNNKITVSETNKISEALIATGFGTTNVQKAKEPGISDNVRSYYKRKADISFLVLTFLRENARCVRRLGSCAIEMCYVAAGRLDAFAEEGPKEWDMAAGLLIVREAGGVVTDFDGNYPFDWHQNLIVASSCQELNKALVDGFSGYKNI